MKNRLVIRYLQFYVGVAIAALGLFLLRNEITTTLAAALCVFFAIQIVFLPFSIILLKMVKEPKQSVLGIDNKHFFGGLTFLMVAMTTGSIFFGASPEEILILTVLTMLCLDTAFRSRLHKN